MLRCFKRREINLKQAVRDMRQVEEVLQSMVSKYERIRKETMQKLKEADKKSRKLLHLKRIKTLDFHINQCELKIAACVHKQYSLEQLEITRLQINAIKASTSVFRSFSKYNPIHKIEDLQDTMEELSEDLSDVTNLLSSGTVDFDEEELESELLQMEQEQEGALEEMPAVPTHKPRAVRVSVPMQDLPV
jgi:DNA-binding ferritin-like protein